MWLVRSHSIKTNGIIWIDCESAVASGELFTVLYKQRRLKIDMSGDGWPEGVLFAGLPNIAVWWQGRNLNWHTLGQYSQSVCWSNVLRIEWSRPMKEKTYVYWLQWAWRRLPFDLPVCQVIQGAICGIGTTMMAVIGLKRNYNQMYNQWAPVYRH